jgi:stage V sporulation protein D (sporulation-specific penicillin-binding protein)
MPASVRRKNISTRPASKRTEPKASPSGFASYFSKRVTVYAVICLLFGFGVVARLYDVAIAKHGLYLALAQNQRGTSQQLLANRGDILITDLYSEKPYTVATNVEKNMVYVVPASMADANKVATTLAPILNTDAPTLYTKITAPNRSYIPLVHGLSDQQTQEIQQSNLAGVYLSPEGTRVYPEGTLLSQVLGFVSYTATSGDEKVGRYGLEKQYETELAGTDGSLVTETSGAAQGTNGLRGIFSGGQQFTPPTDGSNLLLTIDRSIQNEAESVITQAVTKNGADSGTAIVADPKTGAILAMAGYPDFDPNNYNTVTDQSDFSNQATMENFEPGSTFKAITMSAALDAGAVTPTTTYNNTDSVVVDGATIKNAEATDIGQTTMTEVIDHSLNTGAIYAENALGNDKFTDYVKKFGFGQPTNIDLSENVGDISNIEGTNIADTPQVQFDTASFGQGITVTPIQMVQAYMAMANNGTMMQPYIVDSIIHPDGTVQKTQPKVVGQPITAKTSQEISAMLVDDIDNGYGKEAGVAGYALGGKTGTAQVAVNGKYLPNDNIGSFIGYGPVEDPRFVIAVIVDHPRDVAFAETTADPAFHDIASFILNYYQIAPTRK